MRLERASPKAIHYAIMTWHYSQAVPASAVRIAYAAFNAAGEWCGVVVFGNGANSRIGQPYGLAPGKTAELVRVALNGKQAATSQVVAAAIRQFRKDCPLVEMLVSYADPQQQHTGTIYQAMNWVYTGTSSAQAEVLCPETGKIIHKRVAFNRYGTTKGLQRSPVLWKHKYIYPLTKDMKRRAEALRKPYPKKPAPEAQTDERLPTREEAGGSIPTPALPSPPPPVL